MSDIFLIIVSAFAVLGLYYVVNVISSILMAGKMPVSYTFMLYSEDDMAYQKYKSFVYNIANNRIIFIGDGNKNIYDETVKISECEIFEFVSNNLFTN